MNKVGLFSANLPELDYLKLGVENREVKSAFKRAKNREDFSIHSHTTVRPQDITNYMTLEGYNIFVFSGHGGGFSEVKNLIDNDVTRGSVKIIQANEKAIDTTNVSGQGIYVDRDDKPYFMTADEFIGAVGDAGFKVKLFIFNSCNSHLLAEKVAQHFKTCAIGNDKPIGDGDAIAYLEGFCDAIGSGRDYQFAHKFARNAAGLFGSEKLPTRFYKG